MGMQN